MRCPAPWGSLNVDRSGTPPVSKDLAGGPQSETKASGSAFAQALQAFKTGALAYGDFLSRIDQFLAADASPAQLLSILRDSETADPLPRDVHKTLVDRITNWPLTLANRPARFADAPTIVLGKEGASGALDGAAMEAGALRAPIAGESLKGRFQLVELIGEGGMSRVYKALDLRRVEAGSQDPYIAVKVLTLPFHEYFGSIAALQSEAQKLQSLAHPNILRVFDCDRDGETVFMTMEYLEGTRLLAGQISQPAESGRDAACGIIQAIGSALEYAHRNNIVHGDLKPGNVIVTARGEIKVIDFGLARWIAHPGAGRDGPARNEFAATRRYASPQVMAREVPQPADDVYALACIAYQLLTGTHPFEDDESLATRRPPPQRPGLTPAQYAAILKALRTERRDRTATAREFIEQFTAPAPGGAWRRYAMWGSGAVVLILIAWALGHRSTQTQTARLPASRPGPASAPTAPEPGSVIRDCPTCPFMTVLPTGRFQQGSASGGGSTSFEYPQHEVNIGYSIAMSRSDVTVGEFREFITATRRDMLGCDTYDGEWRHRPNASWTDPGFTQGTTHPVTCVSWDDAVAYAQWLSARSGHRYRLPSASEWEYAARAGGLDVRPWQGIASGACADANVADQSAARRYPGWTVFPCDDGFVNTAPVGSFKANAFGLNDMLGNVFQWTQDCWGNDYTGAPTDGAARSDGDCAEHEMRGGSWFSSPAYVSASYRNHFAAGYRTSSVGFRLVREINP